MTTTGSKRSTDTHDADRRLLRYGLLGYAYLLVLIVVLAAAVWALFGTGAAGLWWLPGGLLFLVLSALLVRLEPLQGYRITRDDAPALFDVIEEVRTALDAPTPDVVLLTPDSNASVSELPVRGPFGTRRTLALGLPLLHALPPDELRAVLAHEFAHLSRRHGRARLRGVRLAAAWEVLAINAHGVGALLIMPFYRRYVPGLEARLQATSRQHEDESDALATGHAGVAPMARSLLRLAVISGYEGRVHWPRLMSGTLVSEAPPPDCATRLANGVRHCHESPHAPAWLVRALEETTHHDDTHPSLRDRLRAMGADAEPAYATSLVALLAYDGQSAADAVLPATLLSDALAALDEQQATELQPAWRALRVDAETWQRDAGEHAGAPADDAERSLARARWAVACEPPDSAIEVLRDVTAQLPDAPEPRLHLGRLLLERSDADAAEGVALLEELLDERGIAALPAAETLRRHYAQHGLADDAARCARLELDLRHGAISATHERLSMSLGDVFRPARCAAPVRAAIVGELASEPEIRRAWLVEKRSSTGVVCLAFEQDRRSFRLSKGRDGYALAQALAERLTLPGGAPLLVVPLEHERRLRRRLSKLQGALLYDRNAAAAPLPAPPGAQWSRPNLLQRIPTFAFYVVPMVLLALIATLGGNSSDDPVPGQVSLPELEAAAARDPDDAQARLAYGVALANAGRMPEAVREFEQAVRLDSLNDWHHFLLGVALLSMDRLEDAERELRIAVRMDSSHFDFTSELAAVLTRQSRTQEVLELWRRSVVHRPDNPLAWVQLGLFAHIHGYYPEAVRALREAQRLDPDLFEQRDDLRRLLEAAEAGRPFTG